jgi:group I intron endonuclease
MTKVVYTVTNKVTKQVYVGITSSSIEDRKKDHLEKSKSGKKGKFYEAIGTYSPSAFIWTEIDVANCTDELARKEKEYILKYNSKEEGYNSDVGGGIQKTVYQYDLDGRKVNEFTSLESAANAVNAVKQNISAVATGINKSCMGYNWSYSSTFPVSLKDNRKKRVLQFTLEGVHVNEYKSVAEAAKKTDCNKSGISKVCRRERQSCGGFCWEYN